MKKSIYNETNNNYISENLIVADTFYLRARGLVFRNFSKFDGMLFENCNSIHTLMMNMNIDILFVNKDFFVCDLYENVKPWKFFLFGKRSAKSVIELPAGTISRLNIEMKNKLRLEQ